MRRSAAAAWEGVRAAARHPLRSALTAATSAVAIAVTVNVISLVYGFEEDVMRDAARFGRRTIDVVRFAVVMPGLEREPLGEAEHRKIRDTLEGLDALVVPRRVASGSVAHGEASFRIGLVAAPPRYLQSIDVRLAAGRWLEPSDAPGGVCVLDKIVADELFPNTPAHEVVGRSVTIGVGRETAGTTRSVVGVLSDPLTHRALFESFDQARGVRPITASLLSFRNVYVPERALTGDAYSGISVTLPEESSVDEAAERLRTIWPSDPSTPVVSMRSVGVFVRREWMEMLGTTSHTGAVLSNIVWMIIVGVAAVMLTTLYLITIRERYDELAIRRVEGARHGDVAVQVTAEGVLLSLVGGLAGLPLGYSVAVLLQGVVGFPIPFDVRYAAIATGVSIVLGLMASVLPARRAAALQPVEVLTRRRT